MMFRRVAPSERMTYWLDDDFAFAAATPFDEQPATVGNGTMIGFAVGSVDEVKRLHQLAIDLGGTDEGAPGFRESYGPNFFVAYLRDPEGNKVALFSSDANEPGRDG